MRDEVQDRRDRTTETQQREKAEENEEGCDGVGTEVCGEGEVSHVPSGEVRRASARVVK